MNTIEFDNKLYACREVKDREGNDITVAGVRLLTAIMNMADEGTPDEVRKADALDEEICYYIGDKYLNMDTDVLMKKLHEECPEVF